MNDLIDLLHLMVQSLRPMGSVRGFRVVLRLAFLVGAAIMIDAPHQLYGAPPASQPATTQAGNAHFERARELYKEGPSKAKEILSELDLALHDQPEEVPIYLYKAMVQMGTDDTKGALTTLDDAEKADVKAGTIHAGVHYLRARCQWQAGDFEAAKKSVEPYSAFFMRDPKEEAKYDRLMSDIEEGLKKRKSKEGQ